MGLLSSEGQHPGAGQEEFHYIKNQQSGLQSIAVPCPLAVPRVQSAHVCLPTAIRVAGVLECSGVRWHSAPMF